jgi:putative membrane protein
MLSPIPLSLTLMIFVTASVYARGWRQRPVPVWRAASFLLGLLCTWIAVGSPLASLDEELLTAHMTQHLLLMTFAPPLIWMGEPVKVMFSHLPRQFAVRQLAEGFREPVFCWLSAAAALVAWHIPALFVLGMHSPAWHLFEQASFLVTGLLFWWPVVQPWPSAARWPRWSVLLYLFLATLPCDVLSGLLVFSDRIAYPMYLSMPRHSGLSVMEDQQCAAALMWTCVTVVFFVAAIVVSMQLLSPRTSRRGEVEAAAI